MIQYRSEDERLSSWRRASLERLGRRTELGTLPDPDSAYHARNLAARRGADVRVDSFLGTINTDGVDDAYRPPGRTGQVRFEQEAMGHPRLIALRTDFRLDDILAGASSDLERVVRLRSWVKAAWQHAEPWRLPAYDGYLILDRALRGVERYICVHYSVVLIQACLSLGIPARLINLHRGIAETYPIGKESAVDPPIDEHVVIEVWLADLGRWVMMDPDFDCHFEVSGVPQNAWEIHQAFVNARLDGLTPRAGPGAAHYASRGPDFYGRVLPTYYAHVSIMTRSNFLSDPDGPIPALHLVDEHTPPILWYHGEDLRLRPDLLGPLVVAHPWTDRTPVLTDGNLETGWASSDEPVEHHVEISFGGPVAVSRIVLHWPLWQSKYRSSAGFRIRAGQGGRWTVLINVKDGRETPWSVHDLKTTKLTALRIEQPIGRGHPDHPERLWLSQVEVF